MAAIGRAVEGNLGCALTSVDLSATGITVVGLSNLVQGVSRLPNLHTVCLNDNNLAQEGECKGVGGESMMYAVYWIVLLFICMLRLLQ